MMEEFKNILKLINTGKIKEAELLLKEGNNEKNKEYLYLAGLIAFFKGNEEVALEFMKRTIMEEEVNPSIKTNANRIISYILFSRGDYKKTIETIAKIKEKNVDDYFVLFVCDLLLNRFNEAETNFQKAYAADRGKTKELLMNFYKSYIEPSTNIEKSTKMILLNFIERIESNN